MDYHSTSLQVLHPLDLFRWLDTGLDARRQDNEVARPLERIHGRQKCRRWRHELSVGQDQPPSSARDSGAKFSIWPEDLVSKEEAAAVQCVARECVSHRDFLLQPDLFEVLDLVLHDYRSDFEPQELFNGKAMFDQEHLSYVGSLVEVCRVLHVGVKVHIGPTCKI